MSKIKSKVLSVRLNLADLQSCFDLCEILGHPTNGASGAISRATSVLMQDLRRKKVVPTYQQSELELLVAQFIQTKNPTSMMSMESLSEYEHCPTVDRRTISPIAFEPASTNEDFAPLPVYMENDPDELEQVESGSEASSFLSKQDEFNDLVDQQIRTVQGEEAEELLKKILIGE